MPGISVQIESVSKSYDTLRAIDDISVSVGTGELFGFIGPDGAGKTTLFRILASLLLPDSGRASIEGMDVVREFKKVRQSVGYMPGRFSLYQDLSVEENLNFFASIFNTTVEENYHLIRDIYSQLEPFRTRPAGKLSGGMKQKLALSCALVHKPLVLILDEPTTGVDAISRKEFWEMLKRLRDEGITTVVSTPYMDEASRCDRVALIQGGTLLGTDTPEGIISKYPWPLAGVKAGDMYRLPHALMEYTGTHSAYRFGDSIHVALKKDAAEESALEEYLVSRGFDRISILRAEPTVEDCFMDLMKKEG